jgi:hypothetical protein
LQFKFKLAAAFAIFGLLVLTLFIVQYIYLSQPADTFGGNYQLDETFTSSSFLYGPQNWVPYASKMAIIPGINPEVDGNFYLMFVDLNATANLNSTFPCVRVDYSFSGLHGTAAFHVYGYINVNQGCSWTNRVEDIIGSNGNGWYVSSPTGKTNTPPNAKPMSNFNNICVQVSNKQGAAHNDFGNNTYFMKFAKAGGGLNSLHITPDPSIRTGNITTTTNMQGTFYVDYTGDRAQDDFVLLVAINGTIGNDFKLELKSSVPG